MGKGSTEQPQGWQAVHAVGFTERSSSIGSSAKGGYAVE